MDRRSALISSAAFAGLGMEGGAQDWPGFLGAKRDGASEENLADWTQGVPREIWEIPVGEGFSGLVVGNLGTPTRRGVSKAEVEKSAQVVVFHRVKNELVCETLEAATGKSTAKAVFGTRYEDPLGRGNGPRSTPALAGENIYLVTPEAALIAVEATNLREKWRVDLAKKYQMPQGFFGYGVSPLVLGDQVLLNVGGEGAGIVAFSTKDGSEKWKSTSQQASYSSGVLMQLGSRELVTFLTREGFLALEPKDGKVIHQLRWRSRQNASVNAASPVAISGGVFLSACYGTGAIALRVVNDKLERVWSNDDSLSCHYSTPVHHQGHLYGFHGRQEEGGELRCVDAATGKVRWSLPGTGCGWIIRGKNRLLVMGEDGLLMMLDPSTDSPKIVGRKQVLRGTPRAQPAFGRGVLYCRDDKVLKAVRLAG